MSNKTRYSMAQPPWGYRWKPVLEVNREEMEALAMVKRLREEGVSWRLIAEALTDAGYTNRQGRAFTIGSIPNLYRVACGREDKLCA